MKGVEDEERVSWGGFFFSPSDVLSQPSRIASWPSRAKRIMNQHRCRERHYKPFIDAWLITWCVGISGAKDLTNQTLEHCHAEDDMIILSLYTKHSGLSPLDLPARWPRGKLRLQPAGRQPRPRERDASSAWACVHA